MWALWGFEQMTLGQSSDDVIPALSLGSSCARIMLQQSDNLSLGQRCVGATRTQHLVREPCGITFLQDYILWLTLPTEATGSSEGLP